MATAILSVRVSEAERQLLEMAAQYAHTNLSDFMRRKALECAEVEVLNRTVVEIPDQDWLAFESWLNAPPQPIPAIQRLAKVKPVWE
jgi:uncharacterized protein (DUF1778 family)